MNIDHILNNHKVGKKKINIDHLASQEDLGDKNLLQTENKDNLVSAINEINDDVVALEGAKANKTELNTLKTEVNQYTDGKIAEIVDSAPEALDTLRELAEALGNDPNFTTTILNEIGEKLSKNGGLMSGTLKLSETNSRIVLPVGKDKYATE